MVMSSEAFIICSSSLLLLIFTMVDSTAITVGGDDRWSDSTNYVSWADQFNFTVGDVLVFSYTPGKHNVYEVTKATYQSCNTTTGVDAKYTSGDDQIVLKEAKQYWFICTIDNHCQVGMKLSVNVSDAPTILTYPSPAPAITQNAAPPISENNSAPRKLTTAAIIFFVAAGFLSILTFIG